MLLFVKECIFFPLNQKLHVITRYAAFFFMLLVALFHIGINVSHAKVYSVSVADYFFTPANKGEYETATVTVDIDPENTTWIAWNNIPEPQLSLAGHEGKVFFGPGRVVFGGHIIITVTNPDNESLSAMLDYNNDDGISSGTQNVIFGEAETTPDAYRYNLEEGPRGGRIFDESGPLNSIFTVAGTYSFKFSFRNDGGKGSHPDTYLLWESPAAYELVAPSLDPEHSMPESDTSLGILGYSLLGFGIVGIGLLWKKLG